MVAIERVISCGGAAGSLDEQVLLAPTGDPDAETVVVETTGPVYAVEWRGPQTLVVDVDPVDEFGDPVREHLDSYAFDGPDGTPERVRVILRRGR